MTRYVQTTSGKLLLMEEGYPAPKPWAGTQTDATKEEIDAHLQAMYRTCGFHKVGGRCWSSPTPDPKAVFNQFAKFMYGDDWFFNGEEYC